MILGAYSRREGGGGRSLPRIVQLSIAPLDAHRFRVGIHEEGTGLSYRQEVDVPAATEGRLLALVADLHRWSTGLGLTESGARRATEQLGRTLHRAFLGRRGAAVLASLQPTAVLLDVDERVLGLPWEAMRSGDGELALDVPFGRIVTTTTTPAARRDPTTDDPTVKILAVVNPTDDLSATAAELAVLRDLAGGRAGVPVELDVLEGAAASRRGLAAAVRGRDHDVVHFAGHARFDGGDPHDSSLLLADGELTTDHVGRLAWASPPYLVFNSACQSARVAQGRALVAAGGRANGLPAAFLAAGCEAYVGHFWPVGDVAAAEFAACFYDTLFADVDAGAAVLAARRAVRGRFDESADLAAFGAVFFGDAGHAHEDRRDLAQAV
ncbi:MAG: CHAT domain-containing protein [Ilumatobacteraceae bacterium]